MLQNRKRHFLGIAIAVQLLTCLVGASYLLVNLAWGVYPSSKAIAERYLQAILQQKEKQAVNLTDEGCRSIVLQEAKEDIARFGGSEMRNVTIAVKNGDGSDDSYQASAIQLGACHFCRDVPAERLF